MCYRLAINMAILSYAPWRHNLETLDLGPFSLIFFKYLDFFSLLPLNIYPEH